MSTISVIYPRGEGETFDYSYYQSEHLPRVMEVWGGAGLVGIEALRGMNAPDGSEAAVFAIALLRFNSVERLYAALAGERAAELMSDIARFTSVRPLLQVNESMFEQAVARPV